MALLALCGFQASALAVPSNCTAMWGLTNVSGETTGRNISWYNSTANAWVPYVTQPAPGGANYNGMAGGGATNAGDGLLYYVDRAANGTFWRFDPATGTRTAVLAGYGAAWQLRTAVANRGIALTNIIGATSDAQGNIVLMASDAGTGNAAEVALLKVSPTTGAVVVTWTFVTTNGTTTPTMAGSGDIYTDAAGNSFIVTNTTANGRVYQVNLTTGATTFARTIGAVNVLGTAFSGASIAGGAYNPKDAIVYFGNTDNSYRYTPPTTIATDATHAGDTGATDMGNCASPAPDAPTVSKAFVSPAISAGGTTTLTLTFNNTNTKPVFMQSAFTDTFPTGLVVATPSTVSGSCLTQTRTFPATLNGFTATAGANNVVFQQNNVIPAGGCSVSVVVQASQLGYLTNTVGPLDTTATAGGTTVTAVLTVGVTTVTVAKTNSTTTVAAGGTSAYVITVSNLGPVPANGMVVTDPATPGLSCGTPTFTSTPAGSITTNPSPVTLAALQGGGVVLTSFPDDSTATFTLPCTVTANGTP